MKLSLFIVLSLCGFITGSLLVNHSFNVEELNVVESKAKELSKKIDEKYDALLAEHIDSKVEHEERFLGSSRQHNVEYKYLNFSYNNVPSRNEVESSDRNNNVDKSILDKNNKNTNTNTNKNENQKSLNELFEQAVKDTTHNKDFSIEDSELNSNSGPSRDAIDLNDLPKSLKQQVPKFTYNGHNYSTDPKKRSVILNGKEYKEGSSFNGVSILEIKPDYVIMRVGNQSFSYKSLTDYNK